jgi:hypothetical protein
MTPEFGRPETAMETIENWEMLEAYEAENIASLELENMADLLEAKDVDNEYDELVELARLTADMNPISESAEIIKGQMMIALDEVA